MMPQNDAQNRSWIFARNFGERPRHSKMLGPVAGDALALQYLRYARLFPPPPCTL